MGRFGPPIGQTLHWRRRINNRPTGPIGFRKVPSLPGGPVFIQAPGVTAEMSGDKLIALDAPGETMLTLNPVGAVIWNHLAEPRSIEDVVQYLGTRFSDVPVDRLREDATAFVDELLESGLAVAAEGG